MKYGHYCQFGCKEIGTVILAPEECLIAEQYYTLVWLTFKDLRLPRRDLVEEIINTFRDACCIEMLTASGEEYILPEFDDVFSVDESCRWFGRYTRADKKRKGPHRLFSREIPKLEILDMAAKIINPQPFRAIGQVC